ncbi:MAG: aspartate carbamoyltransferase catalytic subunit [Gammaproteobacteria bacterium]|nr:aspartate carbamoyltransferase catalytic subunit [Gammaproteobacteria bacterium]
MHKHFIDITQLTKVELQNLIKQAQHFITPTGVKKSNLLQGKTIANLFFEPSTRTRCSFEMAAKALGAEVLNLEISNSSAIKGETELDTALNLQAMGVDAFVVRHKENGMVQKIADALGENCVVINAGNGTRQHPSQAVLDMLTISQKFRDFSPLIIAIMGDCHHSRVGYSDIFALHLLGVKEIRLLTHEKLLPNDLDKLPVIASTDITTGLKNVDIILTLRLQKERHGEAFINEKNFLEQYGLTQERVALAKPDVLVMAPGPINRGVEIADIVADGAHSLILQQTKNGVPARMAIFAHCFQLG